jgi:hypothetical protein
MTSTQTFVRTLRDAASALICVACFGLNANSSARAYSPKNADEVEVISLVIASEAKANNWTRDDLICLSIENKDPDRELVKTLRQTGVNICKLSEWRKNFGCPFHVYLRFKGIDQSQTARLRAESADVREINSGNAHVAVRLRDGEYTAHKTEGKWFIGDYVPSKVE